MKAKRPTTRAAVFTALVALVTVGVAATPTEAIRPATPDKLYVPAPNHDAKLQIATLTSRGDEDAELIRSMIATPQAVWFTQGTPLSVKNDVHATGARAAAQRSVPVLVAYNIPFRDCAQFSAGGALPACSR